LNDSQLSEALRSALRIEEESFVFFLEATTRITNPEIGAILNTLAERELDHVNRLRSILTEPPISMEELTTELLKKRPRAEWIIRTDPIPDEDDVVAVLRAALKREEDTRRTYDMLATFTTLSRDFTGLCAFLANEEKEHAQTIRARLQELGAGQV
jgi:rubrerythrin